MSTRSGRIRQSLIESSPPRTRKGVSPTRSPARNRKSSPTGRSAQKSPSRKSPSRKSSSKFPARKSPSRVVKEVVEEKEASVPKSPAKRPAIKKGPEVRLEDVSSKIESFRSTRTRRYEYSIKDMPSTIQLVEPSTLDEKVNGLENVHSVTDIYGLRNRRNMDDLIPRRSSRLKDIVDSVPDIRRSFSKSLSKSVSESISKSIDTFSDDENHDELLQREKSQSVTRKLATPMPSSVVLSQNSSRYEFGGRIGSAVLYLLIPLTVFYIVISCSKSCSLTSLGDLSAYKSISNWINAQILLLVISNFIMQAIFILLPTFGTKDVDEQGKKYCFNAFFSSFCTLNTLFALDYYKVLNIDLLLSSYLKMAITSYLIALMLVIVLHVKSLKVGANNLNPYGTSGNVLYDLFMGRQIHCNLLKVKVKLWLARVSNITTLILAILIFKNGFSIQLADIDNLALNKFDEIISKIQLKPTILVYSMMQIVYSLYFIIGEKKIVSTFYWQSEGLGYLQIISSTLYPYYFTTISKYVADTDLKLSSNILIAASVLYSLGLTIMLISNNIKYEFRKNPLQPSLTHIDSMPTFLGKKLLVSNLWGILRHPNYTGDIMIHVALALPGVFTRNIVAAAPALITIFMFIHRAWRDHNRCRRRYGSAWQRYCKRVPSVIIPKIL
ncbi:delta(14)-sterol reductase TM7SF2 [Melitaea cinxia]|uniref:delta(14)-sterol reductase TM7SF2 n=1 Tax=Melitaea cinxia TaxID=113334 RepID=UPI001E273759|nr:delta(14)-sterol reductase TM7SF2 [Melitaea cinxia]